MRTRLGGIIGVILWLLGGVAAGAGEPPRNVILLIGDGMGPEHVRAARLLDADGVLAMDRLDPAPGLMTTHDYFGGVTDSAASGTALATGVKTYYGAISVDVDGNRLETVLERARSAGKATGLVSSVYLEDATPAVWAAHAADRGEYASIALQQSRSGVEVLLGSGRNYYLPQGTPGGQRRDGRDLVAEMVAAGYTFVDTVDGLRAIDASVDRLLGLFGGEWTLTYVLDRQGGRNEPSLVDLTGAAIEVLRGDPDGFFLMIEGGAIDWMAHNRDAAGVAAETAEFDAAVQTAFDFARADGRTLVVVTADHETGGMDFGGPVDLEFLRGITATTESMWGHIRSGRMSVRDVLGTYAGIDDPTPSELSHIKAHGMTGIGDVLSARAGVTWGWSGSDDGEHTHTLVPVYAYGPGAEPFDGPNLDNTDIGRTLLGTVEGAAP